MKKITITILFSLAALFMFGCELDQRVEQSTFSAGEDLFKRVTDDNFYQEVIVLDDAGTTCYSSSNEAVATIDAYSGEIDILSIGNTYITVFNTGNSMYKPATDNYKLTVLKNEFISKWVNMAGVPRTIPVYDDYDYDYIIDWGDGSISTGTSKIITHEYETTGIFTISISGTFPGIYFNDGASSGSIYSIENWGNIEWQSMNSAFYGCSNLVCNAEDVPNVSKVADMDNAFNGAALFSGQDLSDWDVSNVITHADFSYGWGLDNTEPNWP